LTLLSPPPSEKGLIYYYKNVFIDKKKYAVKHFFFRKNSHIYLTIINIYSCVVQFPETRSAALRQEPGGEHGRQAGDPGPKAGGRLGVLGGALGGAGDGVGRRRRGGRRRGAVHGADHLRRAVGPLQGVPVGAPHAEHRLDHLPVQGVLQAGRQPVLAQRGEAQSASFAKLDKFLKKKRFN